MSLLAADRQASQWIEMTRTPEGECSDELFDAGFALNISAHDNPEFAWDVILKIVDTLDERELINDTGQARWLASNLAAGPLESLLANHGEKFIERLKQRIKEDAKFGFVLRDVWQNTTSDGIWKEIRAMIGGTSQR